MSSDTFSGQELNPQQQPAYTQQQPAYNQQQPAYNQQQQPAYNQQQGSPAYPQPPVSSNQQDSVTSVPTKRVHLGTHPQHLYCPNCKKTVTSKVHKNLRIYVRYLIVTMGSVFCFLWILFTFGFGICCVPLIYVPWYLSKKIDRYHACPVCCLRLGDVGADAIAE
ncbi:hypothetical protein QTN25_008485 [Entamoeba marina]